MKRKTKTINPTEYVFLVTNTMDATRVMLFHKDQWKIVTATDLQEWKGHLFDLDWEADQLRSNQPKDISDAEIDAIVDYVVKNTVAEECGVAGSCPSFYNLTTPMLTGLGFVEEPNIRILYDYLISLDAF